MAQMIRSGLGWIAVIVSVCLAGCEKKSGPRPRPQIAVANSYLAAAVLDLGVEPAKVMSLVPPGMCPGHFDRRPRRWIDFCRVRFFWFLTFKTTFPHRYLAYENRD